MGYIGNAPSQGLFNGGQIVDGTVDTVDLKDSAVTAEKIAAGVITKSAVGLSNVTNDVQLKAESNLLDLPDVSAARSNLGLGSLAVVSPTGTPDGTKFLRDDNTWQSIVIPTTDEIRDPINISPANGSTNLGNGGFSLVSSAFKSLYGETHVASQWQVSTSSSFSTTIINTGDSASLTSYTVGAVFSISTTYYWRVRYKDSAGVYSDWSNTATFVTANTFDYSAEYFIAAGGGSGGDTDAGGGGSGGFLTASFAASPSTAYTATIGGGGATRSADWSRGNSGSNSTLAGGNINATAIGGGGGGSGSLASGSNAYGGSGGSGGGAGSSWGSGHYGVGTTGQGNSGGNGNSSGGGGGGGGGAGSAGSAGPNGNGGIGVQFAGVYYCDGGGGGHGNTTTGGSGRGGQGFNHGGGSAGQVNSGSGGGGGGGSNGDGGAGGSGIVIIRYAGTQRGTGGTITSSGGYTYHTFTSSGTFTA